jgi:hypothetical protein
MLAPRRSSRLSGRKNGGARDVIAALYAGNTPVDK